MIDQAVLIYLKLLEKSGYSVNTISDKKNLLSKLSLYLNENSIKDFKEIDLSIIEKFLFYLKAKGLKEATVKNYRKRLKQFFTYLADKKMIPENPFVKDKDQQYPEEFTGYLNEYIRLKEFENTCFNSMKKLKLSIHLFYRFLTSRGAVRHSEVKREELSEFVKYLVDLTDTKGNPVYKTVSVNRMISSLKPYIQWLSKKGVFVSGFSSNLSYLRKSMQLHRNVLTRKELVSLFMIKTESLNEFMFKAVFVIQYASGLRISELLSLELKDIDFDNHTLTIIDTKSKKERIVQIGEVGAKYLKIFLDTVRPKVCFDYQKSGKVFLSCREGKTLNSNTVNHYLKVFCKKCGITKAVTCHCFRHSYGTHLLENGLGIKEVSDLLGHKDIAATEQYIKLSPESLRKTINFCHPLEKER